MNIYVVIPTMLSRDERDMELKVNMWNLPLCVSFIWFQLHWSRSCSRAQ